MGLTQQSLQAQNIKGTMPTPGFIGNGFYTSKLLFGGISNEHPNDQILSAPSSLGNDLRVSNLTISAPLKIYSTSTKNCYKVLCYDTLTLNSGGSISCDATELTGGQYNPSSGGMVGFSFTGSLGGSGSGGPASLSAGSKGTPNTNDYPIPPIWFGGAGGGAATHGSHPGGAGGTPSSLEPMNSYFQPSVCDQASAWVNPGLFALNTVSFTGTSPATSWIGSSLPGYVLTPVCGGAGGGGCGDIGAFAEGGGGAGGGVIYVAANKIVMNGGSIFAKGQGSTGGGGGGGGGVVILVTNELTFTPGAGSEIHVEGGTATSHNGVSGNDGYNGTVIIFSDQLMASFSGDPGESNAFTGVVTEAMYKQALTNYHSKGTVSGS
jgi:hypothetical protein